MVRVKFSYRKLPETEREGRKTDRHTGRKVVVEGVSLII